MRLKDPVLVPEGDSLDSRHHTLLGGRQCRERLCTDTATQGISASPAGMTCHFFGTSQKPFVDSKLQKILSLVFWYWSHISCEHLQHRQQQQWR